VLSSRLAGARRVVLDAALALLMATACSNNKSTNRVGGPEPDAGALRRACERHALYEIFGEEATTDFSCSSSCAGVCASGRCVEALACEEGYAASIAVHGGQVFWVNPDYESDGDVRAVPIEGGTPTTRSSGGPTAGPELCGLGCLGGLAVDGTSIYWVNPGVRGNSDGTVMKMPLDGGTATTLASGQNLPVAIAIDSTSVYWTNYGSDVHGGDGGGAKDGSVMSVPLEGGTPTILAQGQKFPLGIATDGTNVYWLSQGGPAVMTAPLAGGTPMALASARSWGTGIAVDSTGVYWSSPGERAVTRTPLDGSAGTILFSTPSADPAPNGIAIDDKNVYWTEFLGGGIVKAPLAGGPPTTIFAGHAGHGIPAGIAVDSTSVYWTEHRGFGLGAVIKVTPK
jgi:hypothetical protein